MEFDMTTSILGMIGAFVIGAYAGRHSIELETYRMIEKMAERYAEKHKDDAGEVMREVKE